MVINNQYSILVVDTSEFYSEITKKILVKGNHNFQIATSFDESIVAYDNGNFDLVMIDTELDQSHSGFELLEYIEKKQPKLPIIMTTESNVDDYINLICEKKIGNILPKPLKRDELLLLIDKLITKQHIFGLENYLINPKVIKKVEIINTHQIHPTIEKILDSSVQWNFSFPNLIIIKLILMEMITNALYHSHGFSEEKKIGKHIELTDGKAVEVQYGCDDTRFGISIADSMGKLTQENILNTLKNLIEREHLIQMFLEKGRKIPISFLSESGRGIDLCRRLAGEYYFLLHKEVRTEIVIVFDSVYYKDDNVGSIKILEIK